jgi:hypothetical protein
MLMASKFKTAKKRPWHFSDKEIIPTIEDRIKENDPELDWVLNDIKFPETDISENNKERIRRG